jgi:hypothetical protein
MYGTRVWRHGESQDFPHSLGRGGQLSLRCLILIIVASRVGVAVWRRTNGDYLLTAAVTALTLAVIDMRVIHNESR